MTLRARFGWMTLGVALLASWVPDAAADITFPFTFSAGTPAVADQVNQDFQAVNARQTATTASLAGTWTFRYTSSSTRQTSVPISYQFWENGTMVGATTSATVPLTCIEGTTATMTLAASGAATFTGSTENTCDPYATFTFSATYTVAGDGLGSFSGLPHGETLNFQASKDLNSMILWKVGAADVGSGHALRR